VPVELRVGIRAQVLARRREGVKGDATLVGASLSWNQKARTVQGALTMTAIDEVDPGVRLLWRTPTPEAMGLTVSRLSPRPFWSWWGR
jgi:hypothetical protein